MSAPTAQEPKTKGRPFGPAIDPAIRHTAKLLYTQGLKPGLISKQLGVKVGTVEMWIHREGLRKKLNHVRELIVGAHNQPKSLAIASDGLRGVLSSELAVQVAKLQQNPPKSLAELGNTPKREGRASVVQKLVNTAAVLYDWAGQGSTGIVLVGELSSASEQPDTPAIDVG